MHEPMLSNDLGFHQEMHTPMPRNILCSPLDPLDPTQEETVRKWAGTTLPSVPIAFVTGRKPTQIVIGNDDYSKDYSSDFSDRARSATLHPLFDPARTLLVTLEQPVFRPSDIGTEDWRCQVVIQLDYLGQTWSQTEPYGPTSLPPDTCRKEYGPGSGSSRAFAKTIGQVIDEQPLEKGWYAPPDLASPIGQTLEAAWSCLRFQLAYACCDLAKVELKPLSGGSVVRSLAPIRDENHLDIFLLAESRLAWLRLHSNPTVLTVVKDSFFPLPGAVAKKQGFELWRVQEDEHFQPSLDWESDEPYKHELRDYGKKRRSVLLFLETVDWLLVRQIRNSLRRWGHAFLGVVAATGPFPRPDQWPLRETPRPFWFSILLPDELDFLFLKRLAEAENAAARAEAENAAARAEARGAAIRAEAENAAARAEARGAAARAEANRQPRQPEQLDTILLDVYYV
jgi:hypothetical protein